jgi:hypothetical protein
MAARRPSRPSGRMLPHARLTARAPAMVPEDVTLSMLHEALEGGFAALRGEVRDGFADLKGEVRGDLTELKAELQSGHLGPAFARSLWHSTSPAARG